MDANTSLAVGASCATPPSYGAISATTLRTTPRVQANQLEPLPTAAPQFTTAGRNEEISPFIPSCRDQLFALPVYLPYMKAQPVSN
jgi:hypothetical protein